MATSGIFSIANMPLLLCYLGALVYLGFKAFGILGVKSDLQKKQDDPTMQNKQQQRQVIQKKRKKSTKKRKGRGKGGGKKTSKMKNRLKPKFLLPMSRDLSWYHCADKQRNEDGDEEEEDDDEEDNNGFILIDINNVRGKVGFTRASVQDFCAHLTHWAKEQKLGGNVLLEVDHGPDFIPESFSDKEGGVMVSFAGKRLKADDLIVMDLDYLVRRAMTRKGESRNVVITSDRELKYRCREVVQNVLRQQRNEQMEHYFSGGNKSIESFGETPSLRFVDSDYFASHFDTMDALNEIDSENDSWYCKPEEPEPYLTYMECTKQRKVQACQLYDTLKENDLPKSNSETVNFNVKLEERSNWMDDYMAWVSSGREGYCHL